MTREELVAWLHETGDIPFALGVALEDIAMAEALADALEAALTRAIQQTADKGYRVGERLPREAWELGFAAFAKSLGGTDE